MSKYREKNHSITLHLPEKLEGDNKSNFTLLDKKLLRATKCLFVFIDVDSSIVM